MNEFDVTELSFLALIRGDLAGTTRLSLRAYAVYSYLVNQDGHNCGATNTQISSRTGLDYSGIPDVLEELRSHGLVWSSPEEAKALVKEPTPEQWANFFERNSCENYEWNKRFKFFHLYIRKIDGGLTFNQSVVFSQLVALRKQDERSGRKIIKSTNLTGLSKMTHLDKRTVSKIITELQEFNLIRVVNTTGKSMAIGIPALTEKTRSLFLHQGQQNIGNKDVSLLVEMMDAEERPQNPTVETPEEDAVHEEIMQNVEPFAGCLAKSHKILKQDMPITQFESDKYEVLT